MTRFKRKTSLIIGMKRPSPRGLIVGISFLFIALLFCIYTFFNPQINWISIILFGFPGIIITIQSFLNKTK